MLCSMEKLLYFQGSRFSLGFLWHFLNGVHEACFLWVGWSMCYRDCYAVQAQEGRSGVREH